MQFVAMLTSNPELEDTLVILMVKAFVCQYSSRGPIKYDPRYFAFCDVLRLVSPKGYDLFRENFQLAAPAPRHMKSVNAAERKFKDCILNLTEEDIIYRVQQSRNKIDGQRSNINSRLGVTLAAGNNVCGLTFDGTKVIKYLYS